MTFLGSARALRVSVWRIRYAVECGYIPAPETVLKKRLLFSPTQVNAMTEDTARRSRSPPELTALHDDDPDCGQLMKHPKEA